jgi:hypothetical protein
MVLIVRQFALHHEGCDGYDTTARSIHSPQDATAESIGLSDDSEAEMRVIRQSA